MASGTFRETSKAVNSLFSSSTDVRYLPNEVQQAISAYVAKHSENDDSDSQRLHEELLAVYNKHVIDFPGNHRGFLQVLCLLQRAIRGQNRLTEWWTLVIKPTVDGLGHKREELEGAEAFLLAILDYDGDSDQDGEGASVSSHFMKLILGAWLKRTRAIPADGEALTVEDSYVAQQLESVMLAFGRRKPKGFLLAVDVLLVDKDYRAQALDLLNSFVQRQPPHLYLVAETLIIEHLLKCLMIDTSTTVVSMALTSLIMFLPHIPGTVVIHLPRLFLIYSRLLCWERFVGSNAEPEKSPLNDEDVPVENFMEKDRLEEDFDWEKLLHSNDSAETTPPDLLYYFTFLYGLYPLNFTSYIRKPRKYLKNINFPRADDFDLNQLLISTRTKKYQNLHLLHANFYTTTPEDELSDSRWLKSDPADVVTECMSLYVAVPDDLRDPGRSSTLRPSETDQPGLKNDEAQVQMLKMQQGERSTFFSDSASEDIKSIDSRRGSQVTAVSVDVDGNHQNHLPHTTRPERKPSQSSLTQRSSGIFASGAVSPSLSCTDSQGKSSTLPYNEAVTVRPNGSIASIHGVEQSSRHDSVSTPLSRSEVLRSPAIRDGPQLEANYAFLQREIMLLQNDLKFERFLKQQHSSHIGQLQRRKIKEAAGEAETLNLINANRVLKSKLAKVTESYNSIKVHITNRSNQSKEREADLGAKIRALREENSRWRADEQQLRAELKQARTECDQLRQMLVIAESKEVLSRQQMDPNTHGLEQGEDLRRQIDELHEQVARLESREVEFELAISEQQSLRARISALMQQVLSRESDIHSNKQEYQHRIVRLENKIQALVHQRPFPPLSPGEPEREVSVSSPPDHQRVTQSQPILPTQDSERQSHQPAGFQAKLDIALASQHKKFAHLRTMHADLLTRNADLTRQCQHLEALLTNEPQQTPHAASWAPESSMRRGEAERGIGYATSSGSASTAMTAEPSASYPSGHGRSSSDRTGAVLSRKSSAGGSADVAALMESTTLASSAASGGRRASEDVSMTGRSSSGKGLFGLGGGSKKGKDKDKEREGGSSSEPKVKRNAGGSGGRGGYRGYRGIV